MGRGTNTTSRFSGRLLLFVFVCVKCVFLLFWGYNMSQKKQRRGFKDELWREEGMRLLLSTRFAPPLPGNVVAHLIWVCEQTLLCLFILFSFSHPFLTQKASQSNSAAHRHRLINDVLPQISLCLQQFFFFSFLPPHHSLPSPLSITLSCCH